MTAPYGFLTVQSADARSVPAEARARFVVALDRIAGRRGAIRLHTCHRVELYIDPSATGWPVVEAPAGTRTLHDITAVRHVMRLAVGLESAVIGEDQILHQLRATTGEARARGALTETLDRVFQIALRAGRRARAWRTGPGRSLADTALDVVSTHVGDLTGQEVLVVGAGTMGRLAATAARRLGARVRVGSRRHARAADLAGAVGGSTVEIDAPGAAAGVAAVVVALGGPWCPHAAVLSDLGRSAAVVVDLSQPAAVRGDLARALGTRLVTVDALAHQPLADVDRRLRARSDAAVETGVSEACGWLERRQAAAVARALTEHAERERIVSLKRLWRQRPDLSELDRIAIETMSRHLADRLLREPLERLGDDRDGHRERAARELFGL